MAYDPHGDERRRQELQDIIQRHARKQPDPARPALPAPPTQPVYSTYVPEPSTSVEKGFGAGFGAVFGVVAGMIALVALCGIVMLVAGGLGGLATALSVECTVGMRGTNLAMEVTGFGASGQCSQIEQSMAGLGYRGVAVDKRYLMCDVPHGRWNHYRVYDHGILGPGLLGLTMCKQLQG